MRLGIFGGTFDPPHIGHQILAAEMLDQLDLDKVLWCITADPPHKLEQIITPVEIRIEMAEAAVKNCLYFEISRVEIDRPGPHFAVDTVKILQHQFPDAELIYMIGEDSLRDLPEWHTPLELINAVAGFGVMRRHDVEIDLDALEVLLPGLRNKVKFIDSPEIEISSSQIRERTASGKAFRYYVPDDVFRLIEKYQLYQTQPYQVEHPGVSTR